MQQQLRVQPLIVKPSAIHGQGVFAAADILPEQVIEECRTLYTEKKTPFNNYLFACGDGYALALGFGSLYNHSPTPNARFEVDEEKLILTITAKTEIKAGDEIFIHYGKKWFATRDIPMITLLSERRHKLRRSLLRLCLRFAAVVGALVAIFVFTR